MSKRGISPILATILLVGFVIVLAALIMTWLGQLVDLKIEETEEILNEFTFVKLKINDFDNAGTNDAVRLTLENRETSVPIEEIIVFMDIQGKGREKIVLKDPKPVLPALYTDVFDTLVGGCPEYIEVIPKIMLNGQLTTLINSKDTLYHECSGGLPLGSYSACDGNICREYVGKNPDPLNKNGCLIPNDCDNDGGGPGGDIPPGECGIESAYWSEISGVNPKLDVSISDTQTAYVNVGLNSDCSGKFIDGEIYECADDTCSETYAGALGTFYLGGTELTRFISWMPGEVSKHYTFRVKPRGGTLDYVLSENILHTAPENFIGACSFTLTETLGLERTKEPVSITYSELEEQCPDIRHAKESSITLYKNQQEIPSQIDGWSDDFTSEDTDDNFDSNDEIIFLADILNNGLDQYSLQYKYFRGQAKNYGAAVYDPTTKDFWYDAEFNAWFGHFENGGAGVILVRQQMDSIEDHSYIWFLGSNANHLLRKNGPIRARIYTEDSGNANAFYNANVVYDIYPDKEMFVTSSVEWTSNCKSQELDSCFYIKLSEFNKAVETKSISYEMGDLTNTEQEWSSIGPKVYPFSISDPAWISMKTNLKEPGHQGQVVIERYTMHLFNLEPNFENNWRGWNYGPKEDQDRLSLQDKTTLISGTSREITAWVNTQLIDPANNLDGQFKNQELIYQTPLVKTISPNQS